VEPSSSPAGRRKTAGTLVLGGSGFIGSHLTESLRADGCEVCVIDPARDATFSPEWLEERITSSVRSFRPTTIFHLIGSGSPQGRGNGGYHSRKNFDIAKVVATALCSADFQGRVIFASSGAVYGNTSVPASETQAPCPITTYASTKLQAEGLLRESIPRLVVARLFQVFGVGQRKLVVYDLARRIQAEEGPLRLMSTGHERRDFVYVDEAVAALRFLARASNAAIGNDATFNIASGVGMRIDALASRLLELAGQTDRAIVPAEGAKENALSSSVGDPTKLASMGHRILGVSDEQLERTLIWTATHGG